MGSISVLRKLIESLHSGMPATDIERVRREMASIVDVLESQNTFVDADDTLHGRLSRREKEVMSMMLEGQRLKQIAARLEISVKTVTTHRSRLMKKLKVDDNLGLYRYGIRSGLISV